MSSSDELQESRSAGLIYLDYNATTPVDRAALDAMLPLFEQHYANPSSKHAAGQAVAELVEAARREVAAFVDARPRDVVFTSGATEAANLGLKGVTGSMERHPGPGRRRILVGATEHKAVLEAAEAAARDVGGRVDTVPVRADGRIDADRLASLLGDDVALVAVMLANNETGTLSDVALVARLAHDAGALCFCDVTQAAGRIPVRLRQWDVDLAVLSSHKVYGPKGVGALVATGPLRKRLAPLIVGGGQERGLRAGTVNAAGVVGFGRAATTAAAELERDAARLGTLTGVLHRSLEERLDGVGLNGHATERLPNTVNLRFVGAEADAVMSCMPTVAVSAGSACQAERSEPSHVLLAMGLGEEAALQSLRFSLGRPTVEDEVKAAVDRVADAVTRVRALAPAGGPADRRAPVVGSVR